MHSNSRSARRLSWFVPDAQLEQLPGRIKGTNRSTTVCHCAYKTLGVCSCMFAGDMLPFNGALSIWDAVPVHVACYQSCLGCVQSSGAWLTVVAIWLVAG